MRRIKRDRLIGLVAIIALTTTACGGTGASDSPAASASADGGAGGGDVGVEFATLNSPFWNVINDLLPAEGSDIGLTLLPTVNPEFDAAKQATDIRNWLTQGIDALILVPADSAAVVSSLQAADEAGVPVVILDTGPDEGPVYVSVRADNVGMGRLACEQMGELTGGSGTVLEIQGNLADTNARDRHDGFAQCMEENFPDVEVLEVAANWQADAAAAGLDTTLTSNPDLAGIYLHSDGGYLAPTLQTLERRELLLPSDDPDHIPLVTIDGGPPALEAIRDGFVDATVSQPADQYSKWAVFYAKQAIDGVTLQPGPTDHDSTIVELDNGVLEDQLQAPVVTTDNVDEPTLWGNQSG